MADVCPGPWLMLPLLVLLLGSIASGEQLKHT